MYISQYKIKIDNSLGNTLKIYFNQYLKQLIDKHTPMPRSSVPEKDEM